MNNNKIIISLTTIPSRINEIEPVLISLINQDYKPDLIYLNIPKQYKRFKSRILIPDFFKKYNNVVKIFYIEKDFGPATKFIGSMLNDNISNNDILIITDDDIVKKKHWLRLLLNNYKNNRVTSFVELNLGQKIIWGYLGYAFIKKIYNIPIKRNNLINHQLLEGKNALVHLKGNNSRKQISEKCRKEIHDKYNTTFPFWCCIGCCPRYIIEKYTNYPNFKNVSKYIYIIILMITLKLSKKIFILLFILIILYNFVYYKYFNSKNKIEHFTLKKKYIPKILMQTYYDKTNIPDKVYKNIKKYASNYHHIIYNDTECINFLKKNYSATIVNTFFKLKGAHRADLIRYCFLYKYGGVYLDIKTELIKPIDKIFVENYTYTVLSIVKDSIYQGIIATPPRNPIFMELVNYMIETCDKDKHYIIYTIDFYNNIMRECNKKPNDGLNINLHNPAFNYYLFREICIKDPELCYDGLDKYNLCCYVYDDVKKIIKSRYSDYPW